MTQRVTDEQLVRWTRSNDSALNDVSADCQDARAEIASLRAALKRCHGLIETARSLLRVDDGTEQWHEDAEAELSPCDEAMECPTVEAAPAPQPWESEEQLAEAIADAVSDTDWMNGSTFQIGAIAARIALAGPGGKP